MQPAVCQFCTKVVQSGKKMPKCKSAERGWGQGWMSYFVPFKTKSHKSLLKSWPGWCGFQNLISTKNISLFLCASTKWLRQAWAVAVRMGKRYFNASDTALVCIRKGLVHRLVNPAGTSCTWMNGEGLGEKTLIFDELRWECVGASCHLSKSLRGLWYTFIFS